nr:cyclopropane-fatty-acyl-phospholipid synthase family protein [Parvularcula oceani]
MPIDILNPLLAKVVDKGRLTILTPDGKSHVHGHGDGPVATIRLSDPKLLTALALSPELKAGEAYMNGTLTVEEGTLRDFITVFSINRNAIRSAPVQKMVREAAKRAKRFQQNNGLTRSRQNVAHHYDLSNDLYRLFLDSGMNYSCAYWPEEGMSLEAAQQAKLRHIASKLRIEKGSRVLDIGCGWGSMAIYMAENFDCDVVGVTLSKEQKALAEQRIEKKGLSKKVRIELRDYREVEERFDRIVSIGMFEHVGAPQHDAFFRKVMALLPEDGLALVHSIGRRGTPGVTDAWTRKYIFPGGYSPALSETLASVERSGLWVTDVEVWRLHYAKTLEVWSERFAANRDKAREMFDERFCRMWEFYLLGAELAFRHGTHMNFQLQLSPSVDAVPLTRDYMLKAERTLEPA